MIDLLRRASSDDRWYCTLLLAQLLLVWSLSYFPTQDGPSHLYNAAILHDLLNGGKEWGEYFSYELKATPNLGFNLIASPLLFIVKPLVAEKLFLSLYIILIGLSVPYFISTFAPGKPRTIQLLAIPAMFNFTLMMGFYSYNIAVPVFLFAMAATWRIRTRPAFVQFVFSNLAGCALFFMHLIPFIFFLISLAIIAVADMRENRSRLRRFIHCSVMLLPLILLLIFYLANNRDSSAPSDFSYLLSGSRLMLLISDLLTFSSMSLSPWQMMPTAAAMFALLVLMVALTKDVIVRFNAGQQAVLLLVVVLSAIYFLAPFRFGGGSFFNNRFPWVILLVLLPLLACLSDKIGSAVRIALISAGVLSIATNALIFRQQSAEVSTFLSGLKSGCTKGEGILLYRTSIPTWPKVDVLLHAPSYYGIYNGCVDLGNYEAALPYFPVRFRQDFSPLPEEATFAYGQGKMEFSKFPAVSWVIGWDLKPDGQKRLGEQFYNTIENYKLSLWRQR